MGCMGVGAVQRGNKEHPAHFSTPGLRCRKPVATPCPELSTGEWEMPVTLQSSSLLRSFQASFNKQPKVLAVAHPWSQHPPPSPAVYFLPLKCPATPTLCCAIASICVASQQSRSAGITLLLARGWQAAPQLNCCQMWNQGLLALG